jgi:hypothetical protein
MTVNGQRTQFEQCQVTAPGGPNPSYILAAWAGDGTSLQVHVPGTGKFACAGLSIYVVEVSRNSEPLISSSCSIDVSMLDAGANSWSGSVTAHLVREVAGGAPVDVSFSRP